MHRYSSRAGFTLIELLVVIAVIGILVAILFPVFSTAREKARQTECQSNLMQLVTALQQFHADKGYYPPAPYYDETDGVYKGGFGLQRALSRLHHRPRSIYLSRRPRGPGPRPGVPRPGLLLLQWTD